MKPPLLHDQAAVAVAHRAAGRSRILIAPIGASSARAAVRCSRLSRSRAGANTARRLEWFQHALPSKGRVPKRQRSSAVPRIALAAPACSISRPGAFCSVGGPPSPKP